MDITQVYEKGLINNALYGQQSYDNSCLPKRREGRILVSIHGVGVLDNPTLFLCRGVNVAQYKVA